MKLPRYLIYGWPVLAGGQLVHHLIAGQWFYAGFWALAGAMFVRFAYVLHQFSKAIDQKPKPTEGENSGN